MSYGKHQSFFLKKNWISKGILAIKENPNIFSNNDNFFELGIGKNMFISLKYYLEATNILKNNSLTTLGEMIYDKDLSCKENLTIDLINYFLISHTKENGDPFSYTFSYFFNNFDLVIFNKEDLKNKLISFDQYCNRSTSEEVLIRDINCLLSLYLNNKKAKHPEDKNISLLSFLNLIVEENNVFFKKSASIELINLNFAFFLLLKLQEEQINLTIDNLLNQPNNLGKIFNLNQYDITLILEKLESNKYPLNFIKTNNLNTIILNTKISSQEYLSNIYKENEVNYVNQ